MNIAIDQLLTTLHKSAITAITNLTSEKKSIYLELLNYND